MADAHEIDSADPMQLFDSWFKQAEQGEPNDPNAAALATSTLDGVPSLRMVLTKRIGGYPFCFFTNVQSQKGQELTANPRAALCFHWKSLRRQVRIAGEVSGLSDSAVDAYFHSRSRASQIAAAVSHQSHLLANRETLESQVRQFTEQHVGEIPRPDVWRGFLLRAERIEFWMDGKDRLHDRFLFTRTGEHWQHARLYP
jgi:pyridoxamine 5'-phosphate oxidase